MQFLPVDDPNYLYLPSRNPYWQKIKDLSAGALIDHDTEQFRGKWRALFRSIEPSFPWTENTPLNVEIGCNGGHVTLGLAAQNPDQLFIGIDWKFKQIYLAQEKAQKRSIRNAIFLRARAERLHYIFDEGEVDTLRLFFPDPWQKKSQKKHRYIRANYFDRAAQVVRSGGAFEIRTDHDDYFQWMLDAHQEASKNWKKEALTWNAHENHPNPLELQIPEVTLFERLFIRDGIPIKKLILSRACIEQ